MRVAVVCEWFFWLDGSRLGTGGCETFLQNLIELLSRRGCDIVVFQRGSRRFSTSWRGFRVESWRSFKEQAALLETFHGSNSGLTIYSDFHVIPSKPCKPAVAIQHGVYWDVRHKRFENSVLQGVLNWKKGLSAVFWSRSLLDKLEHIDKLITVDTNFQNWMRSMCGWANLESKWVYVPNFAEPHSISRIRSKLERDGPIRRILFARRFEPFRGTFMWADVVRRMAPLWPAVEFCFCGHGQMKGLECELNEVLQGIPNVHIYERPYEEMPEEHFAADVEIIPSYGSEGTSLSLIEAMAAGTCAVATTVGGLANVVLPDFNGILVQPTEAALEAAVLGLINDPNRVRLLAGNAYKTVEASFSKRRWEERILRALSEALCSGGLSTSVLRPSVPLGENVDLRVGDVRA